MIGNMIIGITGILLFITSLLLILIYFIREVITILRDIRANTYQGERPLDYKTKESIAESLLEEEGNAIEESLYLDKKTGLLSYKAYAENKRKQDRKDEPDGFIDDFEKSAVEAERKN